MTTMSALRAVTDTTEQATVTEIRDERDAYDARMDPEAKFLCALLWLGEAPAGHIADIITFLAPQDFRRPAHARLFSLIAEQAAEGAPIEPTLIAGRCAAAGADGRDGWPAGATPQQFIIDIASLEARPSQASYLADRVIAASYRRQYRQMATFLSQMAEEAPEDDLFPAMVEQGRRQRAARARLDRFRRDILHRNTDQTADTETD
jgi:replicative DNA helicase